MDDSIPNLRIKKVGRPKKNVEPLHSGAATVIGRAESPVTASQTELPPPASPVSVKRGQITEQTRKFILQNQGVLTNQEIALRAGISQERVQKIIDAFGSLPEQNKFLVQRLKNSAAWRQIKEEFSEDELDYFVETYSLLMDQFKEDIRPAEEKQICQIIKLDILMHRNLSGRRKIQEAIELQERMVTNIVDRAGGDMSLVTDADKSLITEANKTIGQLRGSEQSRTADYATLHKEYDSLMEQLKATRNQRLDRIEDNKTTFPDLVKQLISRDKQEMEARQAELFKKAVAIEYERLTEPHQYMDGEWDLPILNSESLEELDNEPE